MIVDGSDVHGEGVNVAARLQAECPPGGICVSRGVRDHVRGRLDLAFEGLGALNLKNIAEPVEAFVLRTEIAATTPNSVERSLVHGTGEALPLPDKPSIAVLAFTNMSGDPEQEYFSDGIADDIITELSRSRSLFVIARNSSFTYKGRAVDIKQVGARTGRALRAGRQRAPQRSAGCASLRSSSMRRPAITSGRSATIARWRTFSRCRMRLQALSSRQSSRRLPTRNFGALCESRRRSLGAWEAYQRGQWHLGQSNRGRSRAGKAILSTGHHN